MDTEAQTRCAGPADLERMRLAHWVHERAVAMAEEAVAAIWMAAPAYRGSGLEPQVAAHCREVFEVFARTIRENRDPGLGDFPRTADHARRRVEVGIPLAEFLKAFRVGQLTLWQNLEIYRSEADESAEVMLGLVSHVMRVIEVGSSAAAAAYLEAQQYYLADLERAHRDVLEELLEGRTPTGGVREQVLQEAGLDQQEPFVAMAAGASDVAGHATGDVAAEARASFALAERGIFVARHRELIGLVPLRGRSEARVIRALTEVADQLAAGGTILTAGTSTAHVGHGSVSDAYCEAVLARDSLDGGSGLQPLSAMSPFSYLMHRSDPTLLRLIRPELVAFFEDDRAGDGVYGDSLDAYVAHDLNAREAARAMHVHVNTMYYRLERLCTRTGTDLRRFEEVVELLLAARAVRSATRDHHATRADGAELP